jgi:hypothetical protein
LYKPAAFAAPLEYFETMSAAASPPREPAESIAQLNENWLANAASVFLTNGPLTNPSIFFSVPLSFATIAAL